MHFKNNMTLCSVHIFSNSSWWDIVLFLQYDDLLIDISVGGNVGGMSFHPLKTCDKRLCQL